MATNTPQTPNNLSSNKGYGKKMPIWLWIVIYVVIAAVLYSVIYYVFMRDNGDTTGGSGY